jgi:acyl-CoA thioester hydrolase
LSSVPPFELLISIEPRDIDRMGHVNNVTYVRWVQDVAVAHWRSVATPDEQANILWIVLRHEIDYKRPALPGDQIIARTWVGSSTRIKFERHTEISRAGDQALLAKAVTWWYPIDAQTKRPVNASDDLRARFSLSPNRHGSLLM